MTGIGANDSDTKIHFTAREDPSVGRRAIVRAMSSAIDRINEAVQLPHAVEHLHTYFHEPASSEGSPPGFTGAWFERLGEPTSADACRLTSADIVAVTTLSVPIPSQVAIKLLIGHQERISALLSNIPTAPIWAVDADVLDSGGTAETLWKLICRTGKGAKPAGRWVSAHKLCARKRPGLLPVYDTEVAGLVAPEDGKWWPTAWRAMQQPALRHCLTELHDRAGVPTEITLLRTLDVVLWMEARHRKGERYCGHPRRS